MHGATGAKMEAPKAMRSDTPKASTECEMGRRYPPPQRTKGSGERRSSPTGGNDLCFRRVI